MTEEKKLARSTVNAQYIGSPYGTGITDPYGALINNNGRPGDQQLLFYGGNGILAVPTSYKDEVCQSRYFYRYDPIASTVINRMADMSISKLRNRRNGTNDEEFIYFQALADRLTLLL